MKTFNILLIFGFGVLALHSCKNEVKKVIKTEAIIFKKEGDLSIFKQKVDTLITNLDIEIADSDYETETGLMYRSSMKVNQGMLFIFDDARMHYFYMKNTEFPLDLIFIKDDLTIASFQENAKPFDQGSLSSQVPVKYVLEVNAGFAQKWLLEVGDKIKFQKQ